MQPDKKILINNWLDKAKEALEDSKNNIDAEHFITTIINHVG